MSIRYVIFDVDDVILRMKEPSLDAEAAVRDRLTHHFAVDEADRVQRAFVDAFDALRLQNQVTPQDEVPGVEQLTAAIARWQRCVSAAGHEIKRWSRDSLLAVALEGEGLPVTEAVVSDVIDTYWSVVAERTRPYPEVSAALESLRRRGVAIHLATDSDGFLQFDDARGSFSYDPEAASARKVRRLQVIERLGLRPCDVSVGDPIGKPSPRFFSRVIADFSRKLGREVALDETLAVGDSLTHDVLPLLDLGARQGVWLLRSGRHPDADHPGVTILRDLGELEALDWS